VAALLGWAATTRAPALRVPPAVSLLLSGVMLAAAWRLVQLHRRVAGSGDAAATLIFAGMAIFGLWVARGSGARACRVGLGRPPVALASGLACRIPFGVGGVLAAAMALYAAQRWLRARRRDTREATR